MFSTYHGQIELGGNLGGHVGRTKQDEILAAMHSSFPTPPVQAGPSARELQAAEEIP